MRPVGWESGGVNTPVPTAMCDHYDRRVVSWLSLVGRNRLGNVAVAVQVNFSVSMNVDRSCLNDCVATSMPRLQNIELAVVLLSPSRVVSQQKIGLLPDHLCEDEGEAINRGARSVLATRKPAGAVGLGRWAMT